MRKLSQFVAVLCSLSLLAFVAFSAGAQGMRETPAPNLGFLGCSGTPEAKPVDLPNEEGKQAAAIRIKDVYTIKKTLADVLKLQGGDLIVKIGDHYLEPGDDLPLQFVTHWETLIAQGEKKVALGILRNDKFIELPMPVLPYHKPLLDVGPDKCERWKIAEKLGFDFLKHVQGKAWENGSGGINGEVFVSAVAGFACLSTGSTPKSGPCRDVLNTCVNAVIAGAGRDDNPMGGAGQANWNQENWALGIAAAFLSEVYQVYPNPKYTATIQGYVDRICKNQEESGGWGHGPGGPNALGYVELTIVSGWCMLGLGLAERAGAVVPEEVVKKAVDYCISATANGQLGYSEKEGQKGMAHSGRNALMILALLTLSYPEDDPYVASLLGWSKGIRKDVIVVGHPAPAMHVACSAMLFRRLGGEVWENFYKDFRLLFAQIQRPDGAFLFYETEETKNVGHNADASQGIGWNSAMYTLILSLTDSHLSFVTGKAPKNWSKTRSTKSE